jgi:serine/threonine protein kinase
MDFPHYHQISAGSCAIDANCMVAESLLDETVARSDIKDFMVAKRIYYAIDGVYRSTFGQLGRVIKSHPVLAAAPSIPRPFFAEEAPGDTATGEEIQIQKRLRLISRWYAEEIIPQNEIDFVFSTALGERDDRAASLVRRVLDSPNATASSLIAVLLGLADSTILRRHPPGGIVEHALERTSPQENKVSSLVSNANARKPPTDFKKATAASGGLGKYELRSVIARSAMSLVYDGWDPSINRGVAIKVIQQGSNSSDAEGDERRGRFKREAQTAGGLIHPNIVGVYDYGETEALAYIVMEFVDGPSLKQLLDTNKRPGLDDVGKIMSDVLTGLQFSHQKGVVHRDIKPSNVMLTASGTAKITDFGIARFERNEMTQAGVVIGTPAYMSPEQFLGERVDVRSDIYSTGVMLFQLLTGKRPFNGNIATIMNKVLYGGPPSASGICQTVTSSMDQVLQKAMARKPQDRYSSANEFSEALKAALGDTTGTARTPRIHIVSEKAKRLPVSGGNAALGLGVYVKASLVVVIAAAVAAIFSLNSSFLRDVPSELGERVTVPPLSMLLPGGGDDIENPIRRVVQPSPERGRGTPRRIAEGKHQRPQAGATQGV